LGLKRRIYKNLVRAVAEVLAARRGGGEKRAREAEDRSVIKGAGGRTRLDPDELRASEGDARPGEGEGNETRSEEYERICKRRRCVYDSDDE